MFDFDYCRVFLRDIPQLDWSLTRNLEQENQGKRKEGESAHPGINAKEYILMGYGLTPPHHLPFYPLFQCRLKTCPDITVGRMAGMNGILGHSHHRGKRGATPRPRGAEWRNLEKSIFHLLADRRRLPKMVLKNLSEGKTQD